MTNEIKSAREAVEYCLSQIQTDHTKPKDNHIWTTGTTARPTISEETLQLCHKALSAYEKLRGVDVERLNEALLCLPEVKANLRTYVEFEKATALMLSVAIIENAARILSDIGKDR